MIKLTDAEIYIMHIIWKNRETTAIDILEQVKKDKKLSENTIRTLLGRMVKKGAIQIVKDNGRIHIYKACINKNEYLRSEANSFLDNIYQGAISSMIFNFVQDERLTKKEIEELLKKIEE